MKDKIIEKLTYHTSVYKSEQVHALNVNKFILKLG